MGKTLKEKNQPQLIAFVLVNAIVLAVLLEGLKHMALDGEELPAFQPGFYRARTQRSACRQAAPGREMWAAPFGPSRTDPSLVHPVPEKCGPSGGRGRPLRLSPLPRDDGTRREHYDGIYGRIGVDTSFLSSADVWI